MEINNRILLDVKPEIEFNDNEIFLLKQAGLLGLSTVEAWTALGTNNQLAYATHGTFRYFGKFPPPIATHLIKSYTEAKDVVFDPMCGSGTTGVECVILDRKSILNDISPLSCLLSDVKTRKLDNAKLEKSIDRIARQYKPMSQFEYDFYPNGLKNTDHWFLPETQDSLRGIKYLIDTEEDPHIRNFLYVVFASVIRRVSRATSQQGRLFLDVITAEKDALPFFLKRAFGAKKGNNELPEVTCLPKIISTNLLDSLPSDLENYANLIILHPPYFNSYKYSSVNSLELAWLGHDYNEVRKSEVREFFKVGKVENVQRYLSDMGVVIKNLYRTLRVDSYFALMIGDTVIKGEYIPVTKMLLDAVSDLGLHIEKIVLRVPKYTEAAWVSSQRRGSNSIGVTLYDFIVIMKKVK